MALVVDRPHTSIAREFVEIAPPDDPLFLGVPKLNDLNPSDEQRFLICRGYLAGQTLGTLEDFDAELTWEENFLRIGQLCDEIFARLPGARVCVIGSESGISGSYDAAYAGAKAAMHLYVETKRLEHSAQQLVAIAPTIIEDSGMTQRRDDLDQCLERGRGRRRGGWLLAREVARLAHFLLYVDTGSISNTVIRQTGGNW